MTVSRPVDYPTSRIRFAIGMTKERVPRRFRRAALDRILKIAKSRMQGNAVECPACGHTAAGFFRGTFCVSCSSSPRTRVIAMVLRRELHVDDGAEYRILHFAPEPGLLRMLSAIPTIDYVPGDLVPDEGHTRVDATNIELAPTFDGIITSHVLEHIPDDSAAMREMHRVLKPGGWAVVLVPVHHPLEQTYEDESVKSGWQREYFYGQHDHVRVYGQDFVSRLEDAGLVVEETRYANTLSQEERERFGVRGADVVYLCRKPAE